MTALAFASVSPVARGRAVARGPALSPIALLMAGSAALFLVALLLGTVLLGLDRITPASSAILGALACAGAAGFHLGLAIACIREIGRA